MNKLRFVRLNHPRPHQKPPFEGVAKCQMLTNGFCKYTIRNNLHFGELRMWLRLKKNANLPFLAKTQNSYFTFFEIHENKNREILKCYRQDQFHQNH